MRSCSAGIGRIASLALLGLLGLTGCGEPTAPGVELERARERWARTEPAAYRLTIQRTYFCDLVQGPVEVIVRDGIVQSRCDLATDSSLDARIADAYPTVDGLFELISDAITHGAHLEVAFDPARGYPRRTSPDYRADMADDELVVTVRDFARL